ncbi:nicotinate-nucleotide--dimethylbenzimidazole phosphoribosyltransferase [Thermaerobacillus caldiproteolyticus]|uniref:nicotinate-nucleotide--dimethylbenzimidazole phosphoribosyltransferase n=1 Tax=Thermaerobacillus caldiproteolyticus TaxID=247480 RepID=UPI00188D0D7A|nr:nicotinate-nucleotide--dimethylbenzimidazole phosphoribosyltransferase [Anoxybacillus caldiproteolyticus]QPA32451.1 nicotinate-nucleotide--dimethylbenzimidazole phosphoribosyltransferase [Anoxybacillus caldiproteolyticus]
MFTIPALHKEIGKEVSAYVDQLTKPVGSLGRLEQLAIELAEMTSSSFPTVTPPGVLVFAADHGVVKEGVSAFPQEVTAQMVMNFVNGGAAINVFSRQIGATFAVVDVGVATDIQSEEVIHQKIRYGTNNFCEKEAMSKEEAEKSILVGYEQANEMIKQGIRCLIVGEIGIGNTTTSSAILAVLSKKEVEQLVGGGTGIAEEKIVHKRQVIRRALMLHAPNPSDPIEILEKIGGLEIAAMTGAMLAAAEKRIPILIDGFICTVAALLAKLIHPCVVDYMILGHRSKEIGHKVAIELLGKKPLIDLGLRLGEGSGAAVAFPLLQFATNMVREMATFTSAHVSNSVEAGGKQG